MIILADESVDAPVVVRLRNDGHTVESVAEMSPSVSDDIVLDRANATNAILMTGDKDFGEMVFRVGHATSGVILVRLSGLSPQRKAEIVSDALRQHEADMAGAFTVVSSGLVRIRHT